jgi:uncharacterized membrane protein YedE/YeeE
MNKPAPRNFLSPLAAGIGLGATLYLSFLLTGHGLGVYGFFRDLTASLAAGVKPFWAAENPYFLNFLYADGPFSTWIAWQVAGIGIGGLAGSLAARRFRFKIERGPSISSGTRLVFALLGGVLTSLGSALARGCTSSLGLSGGAVLSTGAFVFLCAFFLAGLLVSVFSKRLWQ